MQPYKALIWETALIFKKSLTRESKFECFSIVYSCFTHLHPRRPPKASLCSLKELRNLSVSFKAHTSVYATPTPRWFLAIGSGLFEDAFLVCGALNNLWERRVWVRTGQHEWSWRHVPVPAAQLSGISFSSWPTFIRHLSRLCSIGEWVLGQDLIFLSSVRSWSKGVRPSY